MATQRHGRPCARHFARRAGGDRRRRPVRRAGPLGGGSRRGARASGPGRKSGAGHRRNRLSRPPFPASAARGAGTIVRPARAVVTAVRWPAAEPAGDRSGSRRPRADQRRLTGSHPAANPPGCADRKSHRAGACGGDDSHRHGHAGVAHRRPRRRTRGPQRRSCVDSDPVRRHAERVFRASRCAALRLGRGCAFRKGRGRVFSRQIRPRRRIGIGVARFPGDPAWRAHSGRRSARANPRADFRWHLSAPAHGRGVDRSRAAGRRGGSARLVRSDSAPVDILRASGGGPARACGSRDPRLHDRTAAERHGARAGGARRLRRPARGDVCRSRPPAAAAARSAGARRRRAGSRAAHPDGAAAGAAHDFRRSDRFRPRRAARAGANGRRRFLRLLHGGRGPAFPGGRRRFGQGTSGEPFHGALQVAIEEHRPAGP